MRYKWNWIFIYLFLYGIVIVLSERDFYHFSHCINITKYFFVFFGFFVFATFQSASILLKKILSFLNLVKGFILDYISLSIAGRHRKSVFGKNFFGDLPP